MVNKIKTKKNYSKYFPPSNTPNTMEKNITQGQSCFIRMKPTTTTTTKDKLILIKIEIKKMV